MNYLYIFSIFLLQGPFCQLLSAQFLPPFVKSKARLYIKGFNERRLFSVLTIPKAKRYARMGAMNLLEFTGAVKHKKIWSSTEA